MIYFFDPIIRHKNAGGVADMARVLLREMLNSADCVLPLSIVKEWSRGRLANILGRFVVETIAFNQLLVRHLFKSSTATFVFPNYFLPPTIFPGAQAACVVVVHDLQFKYYPGYFGIIKRVWLDISLRRLASSSARIVFISQSTADDFIKFYGRPSRFRVIFNPVDVQMPVKQVVDSFGKYAIAAYHYYPHKNFAATLRLFVRLRELGIVDRLLITGNGKERVDALLAQVQPPLHQDVVHLGYVERNRLLQLYANAAAFLSLSQFEGFNLSAAEAALLGAPLILSDIPAHRELFGDVAHFVPRAGIIDLLEIRAHLAPSNSRATWRNAALCTPASIAQEYLAYCR